MKHALLEFIGDNYDSLMHFGFATIGVGLVLLVVGLIRRHNSGV
jgi:hypothetical protein